jgi:hypothetical protein
MPATFTALIELMFASVTHDTHAGDNESAVVALIVFTEYGELVTG